MNLGTADEYREHPEGSRQFQRFSGDEPIGSPIWVREGLTMDEAIDLLSAEAPPAVLVPYGDFERRWSDGELEGLFNARKTTWQVDRYITLASAQGHVNLSGPTADAARALFVKMGVLTAERAAEIFAAS